MLCDEVLEGDDSASKQGLVVGQHIVGTLCRALGFGATASSSPVTSSMNLLSLAFSSDCTSATKSGFFCVGALMAPSGNT